MGQKCQYLQTVWPHELLCALWAEQDGARGGQAGLWAALVEIKELLSSLCLTPESLPCTGNELAGERSTQPAAGSGH